MILPILSTWMLLSATPADAAVLPTTISANMVLTTAESPYTGTSVTIEPGATVEAEAGVVVKLSGSLSVNGTLRAQGTGEAPVVFTSSNDTAPGGWSGIKLNGGSSASELNHAEIRYATTAVAVSGGSAPMISSVSILKNSTAGLTISASNPVVIGSTFAADNKGIEITGASAADIGSSLIKECGSGQVGIAQVVGEAKSTVRIHDNTVERCGSTSKAAIEVSGSALTGVTLAGNTVRESPGHAISVAGDIPPDITENTLSGNASNAIWLSGTVSQSASWKDHGFPIVAQSGTKSFDVASGATLTLEPGLVIKTNQSNSTIQVSGTLKANGTEAEPVTFTSIKDDTAEGDTNADGSTTAPAAGDYIGIRFNAGTSTQPPGRGLLNHVIARYGGAPASCGLCGGGGPMFSFSGPTSTGPTSEPSVIENSRIEKTVRLAISAPVSMLVTNNILIDTPGMEFTGAASPEIASNTVRNCGESPGIAQIASASKANVRIHDNTVERCGSTSKAAIEVTGSALTGQSLGGNTICESPGRAINYGGDIPPDIANNILRNNGSDEIYVWGTISQSANWGNLATIHVQGSITISAGVTLTIHEGAYIRTPNFNVKGTVLAEGSAKKPIAFTGIRESENGEWGGVLLEAGSGGSSLNYVEFAYGGSGSPMLNISGVSPTIKNSTFRRSAGDAIRVQKSGQPIIEWNRFRDNHFGLRYEGEGKLRAPNDDWGCANGPKPTGCGDEVTSNVEWRPAVTLQELPRLCPGTTMLASSATCLLQKYEPQLRYDSEENYYADSSAEITDNWGDEVALDGSSEAGRYSNGLIDESEWPMIKPLAYSSPLAEGGSFALTQAALGATYPNGQAADNGDWLAESEEYVRDAHRLEAVGYLDATYAHEYTDANGKRWLEYWYWYYYNPKDFAGVGKHQGDWETVIVGLDANNRPEEVIFSQHDGASNCYIGDVEQTEEGGPVVYVGLDSHAGYEKPGVFWATGEDDWADGAGPAAQPGLTIIGSSPPNWILWPGHWGSTRPEGILPGEATSPEGPYFHEAWGAPDAYAANAFECTKTAEEEGREPLQLNATAGTSTLASLQGVTFAGRRPQVTYRVPKADGHGFWPRLRISINELGDGGIPPVSKMISNVQARGKVTIPMQVRPGYAAEVLGSIVYKNGRRVHLAHRIVHVR